MKMAVCALACATGLAASAQAQVRFNEWLINPPGTDQGAEFFELVSDAPNYDMSGLSIVIIEGDCGGGCVAGTVDYAFSLNGRSTGANRLFLWRDGFEVLNPPPEPETVIHVEDFNPDIENGSNTWLIVEGWSGAVGQDLDTNNDGVLDATPWTRVIEVLGYRDGDNRATHIQYATQLGGLDITDNVTPGEDGFTSDTMARTCDAIVIMDLLGANPGPWFPDPNETVFFPNLGQQLDALYTPTPGAANIGCLPTTGCDADINCDGSPDQGDVACMILAVAGDTSCICQDPDFNLDGSADQGDVAAVIGVVAGQPCP